MIPGPHSQTSVQRIRFTSSVYSDCTGVPPPLGNEDSKSYINDVSNRSIVFPLSFCSRSLPDRLWDRLHIRVTHDYFVLLVRRPLPRRVGLPSPSLQLSITRDESYRSFFFTNLELYLAVPFVFYKISIQETKLLFSRYFS